MFAESYKRKEKELVGTFFEKGMLTKRGFGRTGLWENTERKKEIQDDRQHKRKWKVCGPEEESRRPDSMENDHVKTCLLAEH